MLCVPTRGPSVHVVLARPFRSVTAVCREKMPPPTVESVKVTVSLAIVFPKRSTTRMVMGVGKATPTGPLCPPPEASERTRDVSTVAVAEKATGAKPVTVAVAVMFVT